VFNIPSVAGRNREPGGKDILFVHGMWHGGWCWADFASFLAAMGFRCHTFDLRGHGARFAGGRVLRWIPYQRYLEDVLQEVLRFERTPILVGHSLGCLLIECALERLVRPPPAVVLMAPTRHRTFLHSTWDFAVRRRRFLRWLELNLRRSMWPPLCTVPLCREMLLREDTPDREVAALQARLHDESYLTALQLTLGWGPRPRPANGVPVLVIGGGADRAVRREDVEETARFHGTGAEFFDGLPHDLMVSPGWGRVAERVGSWLSDPLVSTPLIPPDPA